MRSSVRSFRLSRGRQSPCSYMPEDGPEKGLEKEPLDFGRIVFLVTFDGSECCLIINALSIVISFHLYLTTWRGAHYHSQLPDVCKAYRGD